MLPAAATLFTRYDPIHIALALMTIVYAAALAFFGRTINKALMELLGLRSQNIDRVRELSEPRDDLVRFSAIREPNQQSLIPVRPAASRVGQLSAMPW